MRNKSIYLINMYFTISVVTKTGSGRMSPVRARTMKEYDQVILSPMLQLVSHLAQWGLKNSRFRVKGTVCNDRGRGGFGRKKFGGPSAGKRNFRGAFHGNINYHYLLGADGLWEPNRFFICKGLEKGEISMAPRNAKQI